LGRPKFPRQASTPEELQQERETLNDGETEPREREVQAAVEQERKKLDDEKGEQEARQFLIHESARVVKEREEHEAAQKTRTRGRN